MSIWVNGFLWGWSSATMGSIFALVYMFYGEVRKIRLMRELLNKGEESK